MGKLTSQEIRFVDNYLKNSGVEFLDVRMEMTDHVASAIESHLEQDKEADFYKAFKSYMIKNKKSLLKNARKQRWAVDLKVLLEIKSQLFRIPALLVGAATMATLANADIALLEENIGFQVFTAVVILMAYFTPVVLYYRLKISFLNRLSIYAYVINYLFFLSLNRLEIFSDFLWVCYAVMAWVNCAVVLSAFKMSAHYKKQFSAV